MRYGVWFVIVIVIVIFIIVIKTIVNTQAFDMLERLDPNPEYWEGKRGAAVGLFQVILHISPFREGKKFA